MAKTNTPADAGAGASSSNDRAQDQSTATATDLVVSGDLVIDGGATVGELPPEIIEQIERAADNLEASRAENASLKSQLETVSADLASARASLESERLALGIVRHKLALYEAMRDGDDEVRDELTDADEMADGLYVMLTSKIPDEKGDLAPRGRLAIIGDDRAGSLVTSGDARPATRADVASAKRPPVRI